MKNYMHKAAGVQFCAGFCWLDPEIKKHPVWLTENSYRNGGKGGQSEKERQH